MNSMKIFIIAVCALLLVQYVGANQSIYVDDVVSPWQDWSWAATKDPHAAAYVYSGSYSYSWKPTDWDGLKFYCSGCINSNYATLEFYINGGSASGEAIQLNLFRYSGSTTTYPQAAKDITTYIGSSIGQGVWKKVTVPLSGFPSGSYDGIQLQANSASTQPTVYIDAMQLVSVVTTPKPTLPPTPTPTPTSAPGGCSNMLKINGVCSYAAGANLPWNNYGADAGTNAWGHEGVSANEASVNTILSNLHSYHARVVRWWLFSDFRAGVTFDANGSPTGIDSYVFPDIDAMVSLAQSNNLYLVFSLFDFGMCAKASTTNGVQKGGRADLINDSTKRAALINNVVAPVLARYANTANILAWEVMNEPEECVSGMPQATVDTSKNDPINQAAFWDFSASIINLVHTTTSRMVTMGSESLKWYYAWTPAYANAHGLPVLNFDFYQVHYYSWMDHQCWNDTTDIGTVCESPLEQEVSGLQIGGKPIVVGELAAETNVATTLNTILANGYAGSWVWSYQAGDGYYVDWTSFQSWCASHQGIINY